MSKEGRDYWWGSMIQVVGPALTWEQCFECLLSKLCMWPSGKPSGAIISCPECGKRTFTMGVVGSVG